MARKTQLFEVTKCTACRGCQCGCKNWNRLPAVQTEFSGSYENPPEFKPTTWTRVVFVENKRNGNVEWHFTKKQCMHCGEAPCKEVCPVSAISHTANGFVLIDREKCIACGACVMVCPFGVPKIDPVDNKAKKCTLCYDRVSNDLAPACQKTCPVGVMSLGDRDEMIVRGEEKVEALKTKGYNNAQLYGVNEQGGLGTLYILPDSPSLFGFPEEIDTTAAVYLWQVALGPVRTLATIGMATAALSSWFSVRKADVQKEVLENQKKIAEEKK